MFPLKYKVVSYPTLPLLVVLVTNISKISTIEQESNIFWTAIFSPVTKSKNKNPTSEITNNSQEPKAKIENKFSH